MQLRILDINHLWWAYNKILLLEEINMIRNEKIQLIQLLVNTENYRFDTVASQKEAIDKMIENQNEKLFKLAEDIVNNGLNPNDPIQISPSYHDNTKFNVLEGNRRVICLKLLNNPDLIEDLKYFSLKKKFRKLHDENKDRIIKEINCIVYGDPTEADKWIKLKHTGQNNGIGIVDWDAQQIQRFEEKVENKSSIALQVINLLNKSSGVSDEIKSDLRNLKITNLDRLISDPEVRKFLGIEIVNNVIQSEIEEKEVIKGLNYIVKDLLDPNFKVKNIYTKDDREDYINKIPKSSKPILERKSQKPWNFLNNTTQIYRTLKTKKTIINSKDRKHLIPRSCRLRINNSRVNSIYYELQKIDITKFMNAVAVTFRVFIELSLDCYIDSNNLTTVNKDSKLVKKISEVANHLESNKYADKHICKGIRNSAYNKNDLLGIETWNAYIHNPRFSPTAVNLLITWDNIQTFIEKLWENVK